MPKTKNKTFKKKIYKDIPEEEKKLKPSFNFADFLEDSKKKLKKEYEKETLAMSLRKYDYQEDVVPSVSEYTKDELKEKKKWEDMIAYSSRTDDGYEWILVKKKIKK